MLVLFETAAGYALFKMLDEKKLQEADNLYLDFQTPQKASNVVKLKQFAKFDDTTEALAAVTASIEGKMSKTLKKMLKKLASKDLQEEIAVADAKLGNIIKDKLDLQCVHNSAIQELMRGIRSQINSLVTLPESEMSAMALGLAHSLSRYKLKFSPDKVDTMIVQAISLLDDLDKELNNYVMRAREWYGWHFPEVGKIITDNTAYAKVIKKMGTREKAAKTDLSEILPEEVEKEVKEAAEISMGTEISDEDIQNIEALCDQILEISSYRAQLYDYLKSRMMAVAPNLTVLVGELVGARLIAHAGSLLNLAKHPSSTVQILGAEKALFRALKTKHDTPKYGLIYHASMVGQTTPKNKGKISRMLAAKAALAIRVDALAEDASNQLGIDHRAKLEARLRMLEEGHLRTISGSAKKKAQFDKYSNKSQILTYDTGADSTLPVTGKKRRHSETEETGAGGDAGDTPKQKVKKIKSEPEEDAEDETPKSEKKKKKKRKSEAGDAPSTSQAAEEEMEASTPKSEKKKKKKKKEKEEVDSD